MQSGLDLFPRSAITNTVYMWSCIEPSVCVDITIVESKFGGILRQRMYENKEMDTDVQMSSTLIGNGNIEELTML